MKPISRRTALTLGGLGVAGTVIGGAGLLWTGQGDSGQGGPGQPAGRPAGSA
ncbi:multicopper oxidase family protein, partial [Cryobacterium sp. TMT2-10]